MSFYDTFLGATPTPKNRWKNQMQESVNRAFENASTYADDVQEEKVFGTLEFEDIVCRVTSLVDAKTGQRVNDDFKKIIFKDIDYQPSLGTRYRFDNNVWLTFSTDNIKTDTSNVYLKRCNNVMGFQDKYGNIHYEPCSIDYKITETQIYRESSIDVPNGRIYVQCQLNDITKKIKLNDRFIFGAEAYKVRNINDFDRRFTYDINSSSLLSFYADYDNKGKDDKVELGIADYKIYNYQINCLTAINNIVGFTDKIEYNVTCNDSEVDELVEWESSENAVATINKETGEYTFVALGQCVFTGKMKNKSDTIIEIVINVVDTIVDEYEISVLPNVYVIKLNKTMSYTIYELKNGEQTDTTFTMSAYGVPQRCYSFSATDNAFSITNYKQSSEILTISCVNNRSGETTEIGFELGGII